MVRVNGLVQTLELLHRHRWMDEESRVRATYKTGINQDCDMVQMFMGTCVCVCVSLTVLQVGARFFLMKGSVMDTRASWKILFLTVLLS